MEANEYANAGSGSSLRYIVSDNMEEIKNTSKGKSTGKISEYLEKNNQLSVAVNKNKKNEYKKFIEANPEEKETPEIGE